ncbi:aminoglycoside phosphotransferase [Mycobacterium paraintracellulare]|uniref:phosphotransferase family protein n=1 Tax=Mycobacterium paraintracellulare TaxID=1138383 RepID=UPI0019296DF8|nr:phosphotransferase family protein [Mycobacterium paraintracellulare]BCO39203.1 aminoglycoside phosphotransferase [Mycobacterium paraintracellulare]
MTPAKRTAATSLDEDELRDRLAAGLAGLGARLHELSLLPAAAGGGNSGITCLARASGGGLGERLIVKVAPPGLEPVRNRDVMRQARLLRALGRDGRVPVPDVVLISPGDPPALPPAAVTRFIEGEAVEPGLEPTRPPAEIVRSRALAAARLLAVLHSLDAAVLGLDGEATMSLSDELDKWARAFASVEPAHQAGHSAILPLLVASMPEPVPAALCHGDFRLGNMLCCGPDIEAVIDWEIWSRSDPRLDLSWMLWISDPTHPSAVGPVAGMPSADELIDAYVEAGGHPIGGRELVWFRALTCYKQASTVALLAKHGRRKQDGSAPAFEALAPQLIARARTLLESHGTVI